MGVGLGLGSDASAHKLRGGPERERAVEGDPLTSPAALLHNVKDICIRPSLLDTCFASFP